MDTASTAAASRRRKTSRSATKKRAASSAESPRRGLPKTPRVSRAGTKTAPRTTKQKLFRVAKWTVIVGLVGFAVMVATIAIMFWFWGRDLPSAAQLKDHRYKQLTEIVDSQGVRIGEIYAARNRRTFVPYGEIPKHVVHAFISAEDANFFDHAGIDWWGMTRALVVNLRSGRAKQGASTITQQVIKTLLLSPERTLKRKFQEIKLARLLENELTKEEILTLYLNQIYFGGGRYGIQEAARYYFAKDIQDIDTGEAALLASLPKSPSRLNPKRDGALDRVSGRRIYVLKQMAKNGYLTEAELGAWLQPGRTQVIRDAFPDQGVAPEWIEMSRARQERELGKDRFEIAGGKVRTTVDIAIQRVARAALQRGLQALDNRQKYGRPLQRVKNVNKMVRILAKKQSGELTRKRHYRAVVTAVHGGKSPHLEVDLGDRAARLRLGVGADKRFNPKNRKPKERFARGDVLRVRVSPPDDDPDTDKKRQRGVVGDNSILWVEHAPGPEGAVVVMEPHTRKVVAMIGGYKMRARQFNRATMAKRQPGSTFKPLVYAYALEIGDCGFGGEHCTPATLLLDAVDSHRGHIVDNIRRGQSEGWVRMRHSLIHSKNTIPQKMVARVGVEPLIDFVHNIGIRAPLPKVVSIGIGSGEVSLLEMTNAYATLAAGGRVSRPKFFADDEFPTTKAMSPEAAFLITDMMRTVVTQGTARRARKLGLEIAGKTGTTNQSRDAWFIGMTSDLVVGVWVGFDDFQPLGKKEGGSRTALPIFVDIMSKLKASGRLRGQRFARPPGVISVRIDKATGLLAYTGQPTDGTMTEFFRKGTEPREFATAPGDIDVDNAATSEYE